MNNDNTPFAIDEKKISDYLRDHPHFFDRHPEILQNLQLHHPSGRAISLIEKQVSALRERNTELRHRLNALLENARNNDRLFERSKRLMLALLECHTLDDLIETLYFSFDQEFGIPHAQLILFHKPASAHNVRIASKIDAQKYLGRHLNAGRAVGGGLSREEIDFLFATSPTRVNSAALVPLYHQQLLGVMAVGHIDADHYQTGMGTLFLNHIGEVLTRLLPPFLE